MTIYENMNTELTEQDRQDFPVLSKLAAECGAGTWLRVDSESVGLMPDTRITPLGLVEFFRKAQKADQDFKVVRPSAANSYAVLLNLSLLNLYATVLTLEPLLFNFEAVNRFHIPGKHPSELISEGEEYYVWADARERARELLGVWKDAEGIALYDANDRESTERIYR